MSDQGEPRQSELDARLAFTVATVWRSERISCPHPPALQSWLPGGLDPHPPRPSPGGSPARLSLRALDLSARRAQQAVLHVLKHRQLGLVITGL